MPAYEDQFDRPDPGWVHLPIEVIDNLRKKPSSTANSYMPHAEHLSRLLGVPLHQIKGEWYAELASTGRQLSHQQFAFTAGKFLEPGSWSYEPAEPGKPGHIVVWDGEGWLRVGADVFTELHLPLDFSNRQLTDEQYEALKEKIVERQEEQERLELRQLLAESQEEE